MIDEIAADPPKHSTSIPEPWVVRWSALLPPAGEVLDLACGYGRHARFLGGLGHRVTAVDRDAQALAALHGVDGVEPEGRDLEAGPWPYPAARFDAIVVVHYLHRPLFEPILDTLRPGGVLIYETFASGNERIGRPSRPEFLLREGELLEVVAGRLRMVAFEQGEIREPRHAVVQRLCAVGQAHAWPWPLAGH